MGTRGVIAFKVGGEVKGSYNHWDSYPSGLGNVMLDFLRKEDGTSDEAKWKARSLEAIAENRKPTKEEVERLKPFTDLGVSEGSTTDWYCLLRETQYNPAKILEAGLYQPWEVPAEEFTYVVDYDERKLEVWVGEEHSADYSFDDLPVRFENDRILPPSTFRKEVSH